MPEVIRALLEAPVAWLPMPGLKYYEDYWVSWSWAMVVWERPEGNFYTLSQAGAARLGVHLVEMTTRQRKEAVRRGVPVGEDGPDVRWAPIDDEGPPPRQPRERPNLVRPKLLDDVGTDYRIERDLNRRKVPRARTTTDELIDALRIATKDGRGRRPRGFGLLGGLGVPGRVRAPA